MWNTNEPLDSAGEYGLYSKIWLIALNIWTLISLLEHRSTSGLRSPFAIDSTQDLMRAAAKSSVGSFLWWDAYRNTGESYFTLFGSVVITGNLGDPRSTKMAHLNQDTRPSSSVPLASKVDDLFAVNCVNLS